MEKRVYAILGAYGGIGSALARRLVGPDTQLVLGGRDEARLDDLADELGTESMTVDARKTEDVNSFVRSAVDRFGRLDGAANCVGSLLLKPAHATTDADWHDVLDTNLHSSFALVRAAVPHLRKVSGSLVLCSSAAARIGLVNHEAIAAAKAGVEGLARSAAASYARWGVRVNAVAPGLVRTPLTASITDNELSARASEDLHPLGRLGEPDEVAAAIEWLLRSDQGWVTGQVLGVDGGLGSLKVRAR